MAAGGFQHRWSIRYRHGRRSAEGDDRDDYDCALLVTRVLVGPDRPVLARWALQLSGAYRRLAPTFLERVIIRDRARFRASLQRVLEWPFERVAVAYGSVLEAGGRRELAQGYAWLLGSP